MLKTSNLLKYLLALCAVSYAVMCAFTLQAQRSQQPQRSSGPRVIKTEKPDFHQPGFFGPIVLK